MRLIDMLLRPLQSPVVTRAYPPHADIPDRGRRGTPQLVPERCDVSADCAAACPTSAIKIEAQDDGSVAWALDYGACVFCGQCIEVCPLDAIVTSAEFELAARRRADVVARFTVRRRHD